MAAVGLISLGGKFVSPELCGQVQGDVPTRRGEDASLVRQVSEYFRKPGLYYPVQIV